MTESETLLWKLASQCVAVANQRAALKILAQREPDEWRSRESLEEDCARCLERIRIQLAEILGTAYCLELLGILSWDTVEKGECGIDRILQMARKSGASAPLTPGKKS